MLEDTTVLTVLYCSFLLFFEMQSNSFHGNHQSLNTVKQWCGGDSFCLCVTVSLISTVILLLEIIKGQAKKPWFLKYIYCNIPYCKIPIPLFTSVKIFYSGFWDFSNGSMPSFPSKPPSEQTFSSVKNYCCLLVYTSDTNVTPLDLQRAPNSGTLLLPLPPGPKTLHLRKPF